MDVEWTAVILCLLPLCFTSGSTNMTPILTQDMNNLALSESTPVGTVVYTLKGVDPEDMPIMYSLVGTDKFSVNPYTGEVMLDRPLDREAEETLEFLVAVEDDDPDKVQSSIQPVTVVVLDENDNPPTFKKRRYEVYVREDEETGTMILKYIEVEDEDIVGDILEVGCEPNERWPEACDIFELAVINSTRSHYKGALVLKKALNYNERQFYMYRLYANDGKFKSKAQIEIKVVDVQNTPPVFSGPLTAVLPEDAPIGTLALIVRARDGDTVEPRDIVLELAYNPLDFFELDSITGELRTAKQLNRAALSDPSKALNIMVRATELVNNIPLITETTSTIATVAITIKAVENGIIDSDISPMRYRLLGDGRIPYARYTA